MQQQFHKISVVMCHFALYIYQVSEVFENTMLTLDTEPYLWNNRSYQYFHHILGLILLLFSSRITQWNHHPLHVQGLKTRCSNAHLDNVWVRRPIMQKILRNLQGFTSLRPLVHPHGGAFPSWSPELPREQRHCCGSCGRGWDSWLFGFGKATRSDVSARGSALRQWGATSWRHLPRVRPVQPRCFSPILAWADTHS